jgi:hypothetical protein
MDCMDEMEGTDADESVTIRKGAEGRRVFDGIAG